MTEGQFYLSHKGFDARHPGLAEYEQQRASQREARGLPTGREFPCDGALRELDRVGDRLTVECDQCGYCVSVEARTP